MASQCRVLKGMGKLPDKSGKDFVMDCRRRGPAPYGVFPVAMLRDRGGKIGSVDGRAPTDN
jgi:hypothetical protein